MKRVYSLMLLATALFAIAGCEQKTASEQLGDDMNKMKHDVHKTAEKIENDLK